MFKNLTCATLVATLFIALCGNSAFASNSPTSNANADAANLTSDVRAKSEAQPNPLLKNKMLELVADAKAGKVVPAAKSDIQPSKSSNWSTKTKVAVGIGIAITVLAIVVIIEAKKGLTLRPGII